MIDGLINCTVLELSQENSDVSDYGDRGLKGFLSEAWTIAWSDRLYCDLAN